MSAPAPGTRPANRRELVVAAASELFHSRGYSTVSMKDIADAVAVGPSSLYRHFRNKNDLLEAVITDDLAAVQAALVAASADPFGDPIVALAASQLDRRAVGVLWHREVRHLSTSANQKIKSQIQGITGVISDELARRRPELSPPQIRFLTAVLLGIATSVSFHSVEVPLGLLASLQLTAVEARIPPLRRREPEATDETSTWAPSRREAIVTAATGLFADRGYAEVSLDDIGAAVGITGPSVYNHFEAKSEILVLAMDRGHESLMADMHRTFGRADSATDALRRLVIGYRRFALENSDLIRLLNSEIDQLPPGERARIRATQRTYIAQWTEIVLQAGAAPDGAQARIRVQAVLAAINDVASTPNLRALDGLESATDAVCTALLLAVSEPD